MINSNKNRYLSKFVVIIKEKKKLTNTPKFVFSKKKNINDNSVQQPVIELIDYNEELKNV